MAMFGQALGPECIQGRARSGIYGSAHVRALDNSMVGLEERADLAGLIPIQTDTRKGPIG